MISIVDPVFQTIIFSILLFATIVFTAKKTNDKGLAFSYTNELKGLAILMVILGHAGYFLFSDHRFLFPLSTVSRVGVDIFLLLSGFGLTFSELKSKNSILNFYKFRLKKIFTPMWTVLLLLLILDFFFLGKSYSTPTIMQNFLGFFPTANIYSNINSPLWYFSLILFYYLIFPLIFWLKKPILSIILMFVISIAVTLLPLPVNGSVLNLYRLHNLAFLLGMVLALVLSKIDVVNILQNLKFAFKYSLVIISAFIFGFLAIHSGVGQEIIIEQLISLLTMTAFLIVVLLIPFQSKFLIIFGIYSYEIYLIQWPLVYRYDFLYKYLPASVATFGYLFIYLLLAFGLNKFVKLIYSVFEKRQIKL